jgi:PAS domain S-box-containing protein
MSEPRVLVVDDEEGPREAIRMILKPRYQVLTAGSGEEVLAALPGLRPDVIFMDVKMPRMDGVQLLERVKAIDPGVEVVMITAYASLDTVQRAMRFGAMDYLVKPFAPRELQEAAERALARRRQRTAPGSALAPLIGKMRDLAQRRDPVQGGDLVGLLRAMLHEAQRVTGAAAASFLGMEPSTVVHAELPIAAGDAVTAAWRTALQAVKEPISARPGVAWPLPWPAELDELGYEAAVVVPAVDEGLPRVSAHLVLYHHRAPSLGGTDLAALRPVTDLIVTAVRTSALLTASARQAAEQSIRAVQGEILRQISSAVLVDPALDRTLDAITEQLQQGAGYERVQVLLDPEAPATAAGPGRTVFPLVAQGRQLGALVIETARELDPSERELLRMFSESVALIVRNANLHGELSEAKSFLENLIQSATESIVAVDPAGRVVTWNPAAERLFGRGADEARGKLLGDAMPAAVMVQLEPVLAAPRASRTVVLRIQQEGDRALQDLTATCSPIPWGGRDEIGLLLMIRDVTEQRRWEEQLARSEKLSALGQLAMGMAHDFTNLLQAILGHTQLIAHEPSPERLHRGLSTIEQAVRDGVETVGRIRRFARRDVDRRLERVDLREVVRQAIEIVRPRWSQSDLRGAPIMVRQQLGAVPAVQARGAELREALINLVLNAVDAMPHGGSITLETRQAGDWVLLSIADTGTGIAPDARRRIFEPFFTTKESGTGLGLSIVSGIISSYGGTIDVDSEVGRGTTFTIRLPPA